MADFTLQLLGSPQLELDSKVILFRDDKRFCLLSYLAYKADWVSREHLANLFWSDTDNSTARKNLRHLIQRTRALDWLTGFETELEHVRWLVPTDVKLFRKALEESAWDQALLAYHGVFLGGFQADEVPEFADWLELERESLKDQWHNASLNQARVLQENGVQLEALRMLENLMKIDPLDEIALELLMRIAAQAGQNDLALRSFGGFTNRLQTELNLPPPTNLEQLAQNIRRHEVPTTAVATLPKPVETRVLTKAIPIIATTFVGRELVLAELTNLLERHESRLISLVGTGGVGKTRIALQIALEQQVLQEVGFVNLVPLSTPSAIPPAIAESLGLNFQGKESTQNQLAKHIAQRRMLLVIDNFEHLLEGKSYVTQLLSECPRLTVLTTSREPLGLHGEQTVPVEGFSVPERTDLTPAEIPSLEAVQLFVSHARRVRPDFELTENNFFHVLEICQLVDGLPLGIELAAVWVRALPVWEIAFEITQSLDILSSRSQDLAERHRSVRAAFEHSWKLLTIEEQQALRRLSVFRGGFTREAVRHVTRMPLAVLGSLIDKSLLNLNTAGRYRRHRLLHQYMQEKLAENANEDKDAHTSHGQYYFRVLQKGLEGIRGPHSRAALEELELEFENIRVAWSWAIQDQKLALIKSETEALMRFFDARGRYAEAIDMLGEAIKNLTGNTPEEQATLGTLLIYQSKFFERCGQLELAEQRVSRGLSLLEPSSEHETMIWGWGNLGTIADLKGDHEQAMHYRELALGQARALANERLIAVCLGWVAISEEYRGNVAKANQSYREAIRLFKQLGNRIGTLFNLNGLATSMYEADNLNEARTLWLEALELAQTSGELSQIPEIMANLGNCYCQLNQLELALTYTRQSLELEKNKSTQTPAPQVELLITLAKISLAQTQITQAKMYLHEALEIAWNAQEMSLVMAALLPWEELLVSDDLALKNRLSSVLNKHLATRTVSRDQANQKLEARAAIRAHSTFSLELEALIQQLQAT